MILAEQIGGYSQVLRVNRGVGNNEVEIKRNGEVLYSGLATNIIDTHNRLYFKDQSGREHEYIKRCEISLV